MFSWIQNLKQGLTKSSSKINNGLKKLLKSKKINQSSLDELFDLLISSDIGVPVSEDIVKKISKLKFDDLSLSSIKKVISETIFQILKPVEKKLVIKSKPHVILMVGVNGSGKTSTIGKLAHKYSGLNKKIGIVAADTFRAAAVEQLQVWAQKNDSKFFSSELNSDPASLVFKSYKEAVIQEIDILFIDTAGRLHNKSNLMEELAKIIRVLKKIDINLPHDIILILDANTGQNSLLQSQKFNEVCNISGLIITKLDGTAKGGFVLSITKSQKIPIFALGIGEKEGDLIDFNALEFSNALLDL